MANIAIKGTSSGWLPVQQPPEPPRWNAYNRPDGLRVRLKSVHGVTQGDALKVLKDPYYFQCAPLDEFGVPTTHAHLPFSNYKGDQFLQRAGKELKVITFRTLVVEWGRFATMQNWDLPNLVRDLQRLVDAGWPFDLLAIHPHNQQPEVHVKAVLTSLTSTEVAGEEDARYLDVTFNEWRPQAVSSKGLSHTRSSKSKHSLPFTLKIFKDGKYKIVDRHSKSGYATLDLHGETLTFASLAKYAYGSTSLAKHLALAQKPPIRDWGMHTALHNHPRFKKGGKLLVPDLQLRAVKGGGEGFVPGEDLVA